MTTKLTDLAARCSHALIALAAQIAWALVSCRATSQADWLSGGLGACLFWAGREIAQAEYRYIAQRTLSHLREAMPWWGGLDPRVWAFDSFFIDLALPMLCVAALGWLAS